MTDHAIATRGLVKRYGQQEAVNGLEMRVPAGAVYGCLGRNGAGKSTTIKMLMGLARPDSGSASVLGFDCATQTVDILRRVAFVGENKTLYGELTPEEMVEATGIVSASRKSGTQNGSPMSLRRTARFDAVARRSSVRTR